MTDETIVARVRAGDAALFEILMRRNNQRVYRAVRAILGTDEDAEDVMQQAYLNAYTHLHQFNGQAQFSTWLTRIAINEALAMRRRRSNAFQTGEEDAMSQVPDVQAVNPEQQTLTSELRDLMEREVSNLPDSFRAVLVMRDVEGLSTAETASSLGVSTDLVKQRLHRARNLLRDNLFRHAGVGLESLYVFGNARCDRIVSAVMNAINAMSETARPMTNARG